MKTKLLIATTAVALAAGTCYGVAQDKQDKGPAAQTPPAATGQMNQSGAMDKKAESPAKADQSAPKQAQESKSDNGAAKPSTSGQAPSSTQSQSGSSMSPSPRGGSDSSKDTTPMQRSGTQSSSPSAQTAPCAKSSSDTAQKPGTSTTQSTAARGSSTDAAASLSTEQRTQIRTTVLAQKNAPRVNNVNFSLSVGTVVPRTVRVVVLPDPIIRIHPAWRGYRYFLVGDEIVIVEPGSLRIVAVIPA